MNEEQIEQKIKNFKLIYYLLKQKINSSYGLRINTVINKDYDRLYRIKKHIKELKIQLLRTKKLNKITKE